MDANRKEWMTNIHSIYMNLKNNILSKKETIRKNVCSEKSHLCEVLKQIDLSLW